jgi:hypothetical protein
MKKRYTFKTKTKNNKRRLIKQSGGSVDTIALCLPMDASDISMLPFCLKSVKEQTKKPDSVYMSISGVTPESEAAIKQIITDSMIPNINVKFNSERIYAGGNRNIAGAAALAGGATLLTFMDVDDAMHPQRIEQIARAFSDPSKKITGLLHSWIGGHKKDAAAPVAWMPITGIVYPNAFTAAHGLVTLKQGGHHVQNGHLTVIASFFKMHRYDPKMAQGEDQDYNAKIVEAGNLAFTPDALSVHYG